MKGKSTTASSAAMGPESVSATLAANGVAIDPARAASAAATLEAQVGGLRRATTSIAFEIEPATYLKVSAGETP